MRKIPGSGLLRHLGILNIERASPVTPEVPKVVLHMKGCGFIESPPVAGGIGGIPVKKRLPFAEGKGPSYSGGCGFSACAY